MQRLECSDGKSNKFWEVEVVGCDLTVRFGRIGTSGQENTKTFVAPDDAIKERDKLIKEKTRKGYQLIGADNTAELTVEAPPLSSQDKGVTDAALGQLELAIISDLLSDAADRHLEHTCTDYFLEQNDDNRAIINAATLFDGKDESVAAENTEIIEIGTDLFVHDYRLMEFLAARCGQLARRGRTPRGNIALPLKRLNKAELVVVARLLSELSADEFGEYEHEEGCEDFSLDASDENKQFIESVLKSSGSANIKSKIKSVRTADEAIEVHAVYVLAYLAQRCRSAATCASNVPELELATEQQSDQTPPVQPLGTYKGWKSEKALLKAALSYAEHRAGDLQESDHDLRVYADGGNPFKEIFDKTKTRSGPLRHDVVEALQTHVLAGEAPGALIYAGKPESNWLPEYERSTAYRYWGWRIECQAMGTWLITFLDKPVEILADCLTLGWLEEARIVAETIRSIYEKRMMECVQGKSNQTLYHWLIRICFDFWDMPFSNWGKGRHVQLDPKNIFAKNQCFGEPVLNVLFDHWRDSDFTPFADHLVWLCDYYTHRTRPQQFLEFGNRYFLVRFPATILAWLRLREALGLPNPTINHPLMNAPYAKLPQKRPMYSDPLLEKVLTRLQREEMPDLGGGVAVAIKFVDKS